MDDKLKAIYADMLTESENANAHQDMNADGKMKPKEDAAKNVKLDTPVEGQSQEEVKKGGAQANSKNSKETVVSDSFNFSSSSSFEDLYKSVIGEEEDIMTAPDVESDGFDDELGDFEGDMEDDIEEETDIGVELRMMAERLKELADKYSEPEDEEFGDDDFEGDDLEGDDDEEVFEAVKSEPEPRVHAPKTNRSKTAKGKLSSVSKKRGQGGIKGKHDGSPQPFSDKKGKTNTKGNTAKANGPSASKKATDAFC